MNDTINVANTGSSPAIAAGNSHSAAQSPIASGIRDDGGGDSADSIDNDHSFSESLSKVNEQTDTDNRDSNTDEGGNFLPNLANTGEKVANDGPILLSEIIETVMNHSNQASNTLNLPDKHIASQNNAQILSSHISVNTADSIEPLPIDSLVKGEVKTSQLATSMHSAPILQNVLPAMLKGETAKVNSGLAISNNEKLESPQLDLDKQNLSLDKKMFSELLKNSTQTGLPAQQLNILTEIQGSLSQRLDASSVTSRMDTVTLPLTQSANSSPLSIQTTPLLSGINEPFSSPGWSKALGNQIVWMANQNIKTAEIRLNPANLGPVEVRLEIKDDQINVALSSRHAAVREAMEMTMPKLREMLENDGLNLSDSNISHQSFAEQREQQTENQSMDKISRHLLHVEQESVMDKVIMQKTTSSSMVDYFI